MPLINRQLKNRLQINENMGPMGSTGPQSPNKIKQCRHVIAACEAPHARAAPWISSLAGWLATNDRATIANNNRAITWNSGFPVAAHFPRVASTGHPGSQSPLFRAFPSFLYFRSLGQAARTSRLSHIQFPSS